MACSSGSAKSAGVNSLLCLLPIKLQQQSCFGSCRATKSKATEKEKGEEKEGREREGTERMDTRPFPES